MVNLKERDGSCQVTSLIVGNVPTNVRPMSKSAFKTEDFPELLRPMRILTLDIPGRRAVSIERKLEISTVVNFTLPVDPAVV